MQTNEISCCALLLLALCTASGCSQPSAPGTGSALSAVDQAAASVPANDKPDSSKRADIPIDCHKLFSPADVAEIFTGAVTVSAYTKRDNACVFKSADSSQVQVSGDEMERALWIDTEVNQRDKSYKRISGLGDEEFFKASDDGAQVFVKKGDHYCGVAAGINQPKLTGETLARRLGALCDKYLAAR